MALATKPRPKIQHRKRKAQHHKHTSVYLKPYWPYLPMLAIVGLGVIANRYWPSSLQNSLALSGSAQPVTRVEVLTGNSDSWALAVVVIMSAIAGAIFVFQHWYRLHRLLNQGERFVVKHPLFDITLVALCTAGVVLTRAAI